jgi:Uma2 family endonuclease
MTTQPKPARMTADEFLVWSEAQPSGRYELVGGIVVEMAAERAGHAKGKGAVFKALSEAIEVTGLACDAIVDGMAVRIDETTIYEPDVLVRCGEPVHDDALEISDPIVIVEVVSPSSRSLDTGAKLAGYFELLSVQHYLVVNTVARVVTHHRRAPDGKIAASILREGRLALDPPGIEVEIERMFATR